MISGIYVWTDLLWICLEYTGNLLKLSTNKLELTIELSL